MGGDFFRVYCGWEWGGEGAGGLAMCSLCVGKVGIRVGGEEDVGNRAGQALGGGVLLMGATVVGIVFSIDVSISLIPLILSLGL